VKKKDDQPRDVGYVYAVTQEEAYLQADEEEKPALAAEPFPDDASIICSFCGRSAKQVSGMFAGQRPVRDPRTLAIMEVWICKECITRLAANLAKKASGTP
jgi:hypothetical protein